MTKVNDNDAATPLERDEQRALWQWVQLHRWRGFFFHVPNERPNRVEASTLAGLGVQAGVPDNWLVLPHKTYRGHVHELKRKRPYGQDPGVAQMLWLTALQAGGWHVRVCFGAEEAIAAITEYLGGVDWDRVSERSEREEAADRRAEAPGIRDMRVSLPPREAVGR